MEKKQYILERNEELTKSDKKIIKYIYSIILNEKAISLFFHLDEIINEKRVENLLNLKDMLLFLNLKKDEFNKFRKKLEAVGLLRTYESNLYSNYIIEINKPMQPNKIKNNKLFSKEIIKKIGNESFELLIEKFNNKKRDKTEYQEITAKFYEEFQLTNENDFNIASAPSKEISINQIHDFDEAKKLLNFERYIEFLTKAPIVPSTINKIKKYLKQGFTDQALNEISYFCFEVNGKVYWKYFEKVANTLLEDGVLKPEDINLELSQKMLYKKQNNSLISSFNVNSIAEESGVELEQTQEISVDEIIYDIEN